MELLYRYINWDDKGSKKLFSENELFFYSAEPWKNDGEYVFELVDLTHEKVFDFVLKIAIDMHNTDFKQYELWMNVQAQKYGINLNELAPVEVDLADQYFAGQIAKERISKPEEFIEGQRQLYFERTGIISFSKSKCSYNLWTSKRNTLSDNVICVGVDSGKLKEILQLRANCIMNEIAYSDKICGHQLVFDKTGYKSLFQLLELSFNLPTKHRLEDEVRILQLFVNTSEESKERSIFLQDDIFKEVIIFKDADDTTYSEVMKLAKDKGIKEIAVADIKAGDNSVTIDYL